MPRKLTSEEIEAQKDFLFRYTLPNDKEFLLRKMPLEFRKREEEKSKNNFLEIKKCPWLFKRKTML